MFPVSEVKYNFCNQVFVLASSDFQKRLRTISSLWNTWNCCKIVIFFSFLQRIPARSTQCEKILIYKFWYFVEREILTKIYLFLETKNWFSKILYKILSFNMFMQFFVRTNIFKMHFQSRDMRNLMNKRRQTVLRKLWTTGFQR